MRSPGQPEITGPWLSTTATVKLQVLVLPLPSWAEQVTTVNPLLNRAPFVGTQLTGTTPSQASTAVGSVQVTAPEQSPRSVAFVISIGHPLITGAAESITVKVATELVTVATALRTTT